MLSTIFVVAFFSAVFEILIAQKVPTFRRWSGENMIINLVGSMFISFLTGYAFGAGGTILACAALISTLMTVPYYKAAHFWYDDGGWQRWEAFKIRWSQLLKDTGQFIHTTLRAITGPVRAFRAIRSFKLTTLKGHFS